LTARYGVHTLFRIGLNHGNTQDALRVANALSGNLIHAGQPLTIPGASVPAVAQPAMPPLDGLVHVVLPGETLFRIGQRYNLTWTTIQRANHLSGIKIYAGQRLIIPRVRPWRQ
jgi:LysM repeat protein